VLEELKKIARLTVENLKRICICCLNEVGVNQVFQHGICENGRDNTEIQHQTANLPAVIL